METLQTPMHYQTASRLFSGGSKVRLNGDAARVPLGTFAGVLARAMHTLVERVNSMDPDDRGEIKVETEKEHDMLKVTLYNPENNCSVEFRAVPAGERHYTAVLAYGKNGAEPHYLQNVSKEGQMPKGMPHENNGKRVFRARSTSHANFLQGYLFANYTR